jgi:serine/threonine-protein kinase PknG
LRALAPAEPPRPDADQPALTPEPGPLVPVAEAGRETQARPEPWWGLSLIEPAAALPAPSQPADAGALVPEDERFCLNGHPVRRNQGFCTKCGGRYDLTRPQSFQVIADRYEVKRKLGAGAFGAALLAYDRNLGTDVVLKDLTQSVARTAVRERNALVGLRHDSIVRIYGYESEGPYLVLEYVHGTPLSVPADDRLEVILGHGLQILQALDYLHARGLLHMDVKPENIIRFSERGADGPRDRVRLIDFGAVRELARLGPADIYTYAFAPPEADPGFLNPTVDFDLFCLGRTLQTLCRRHLRETAVPGVVALDALIKRATDIRTPGCRFMSARQFAEQLSGVIRQVVTGPPGNRRVARPSAVFGTMTEPLHGGLATPRPLGHWIETRMSAERVLIMAAPFAAPAPADVVAALPTLLADPQDVLAQASEASLTACRTALRQGELAAARGALNGTRLPASSWARAWYSGLITLAEGDARTAAGDFGAVRDALPGELIPLLALGLCAEIGGDLEQARRSYQTVTDTAPAFSTAAFALARVLLLAGQRDEAVATAERLADELAAGELRFEQDARIAAVRLLAAVTDSGIPAERDLARAQEIADGLRVGPDIRIGLDTEIQYGRSISTRDWLALSEQIRRLAPRLAVTERDYFALIDLANRLRPEVGWLWRQRLHRIPHHASA